MTILYTARATFDRKDGASWDEYIKWSKIFQLKELVSIDGMLNEDLINPDKDSDEFWKYIVIDQYYHTGFYTSLDYVLKNMATREEFNLLAVAINPEQDCRQILIEDFQFLGYDLLDYPYYISALTNCGGFDETFLPSELNHFGLLDMFDKALDIKERLLKNNPDEDHADTNVIAIWRHKTIGRRTL